MRRIFHTANFPYDGISVQRNSLQQKILMAKLPYDELSLLRNFLQRNFLAPSKILDNMQSLKCKLYIYSHVAKVSSIGIVIRYRYRLKVWYRCRYRDWYQLRKWLQVPKTIEHSKRVRRGFSGLGSQLDTKVIS